MLSHRGCPPSSVAHSWRADWNTPSETLHLDQVRTGDPRIPRPTLPTNLRRRTLTRRPNEEHRRAPAPAAPNREIEPPGDRGIEASRDRGRLRSRDREIEKAHRPLPLRAGRDAFEGRRT